MLTLHVFGAAAADGTGARGLHARHRRAAAGRLGRGAVAAARRLPGHAAWSSPSRATASTRPPPRTRPTTRSPGSAPTARSAPPTTGHPLSASSVPVVYDPSANIDVASGKTYPTAVRQTVTLLFANPLPAGSYEVVLAPAIQAAVYNADEAGLLAGDGSFAGHPVVDRPQRDHRERQRPRLDGPGHPGRDTRRSQMIAQGTPFLTQLQGDLGALLDKMLTQKGDDPTITAALNSQILARFAPAIAAAGGKSSSPTSYLIVWFDPVSINLQSSQGQGVSYSLATNALRAISARRSFRSGETSRSW